MSELHAQLTSMLKAMVPHAWVLGAGDDSDSQPVLGSYGPRDRCVAERELKTHVACHRALCTIEMLSHTPDGVYRSQLSLPVDAGRLRMDDALRQLIGERLDALHP